MIRAICVAAVFAVAAAGGLRATSESSTESSSEELALTDPLVGVTTLVLGSPIYGMVASGQYNQYTVSFPTAAAPDLTVNVVPISGDPDVYITTDGSTPSTTNYQMSSNGLGAEHILLNHTSSFYCKASSCVVNIAVFGFGNSSYNLLAFTTDTLVVLPNGTPVFDALFATKLRQFRFWAGSEGSSVSFQTTSFSSGVSETALAIYVSTNANPGPTNFMWSSGGNDGRRYPYVHISSSDSRYCYGCAYYVSVLGPSSSLLTAYTLLGLNGVSYVRLLSGIPQNAFVNQQSSVFFGFDAVFLSKEVDIVVKANSGDPDIYVTADGSQPGPSNYQWKSISVGSDAVNVTSSDPYWKTNCILFGCNFNIAVNGFVASTFVITVNVK